MAELNHSRGKGCSLGLCRSPYSTSNVTQRNGNKLRLLRPKAAVEEKQREVRAVAEARQQRVAALQASGADVLAGAALSMLQAGAGWPVLQAWAWMGISTAEQGRPADRRHRGRRHAHGWPIGHRLHSHSRCLHCSNNVVTPDAASYARNQHVLRP